MRITEDNNIAQTISFIIALLVLIAVPVWVFFTLKDNVAEDDTVLLPGDTYAVGGTIKTRRYIQYGGRSQDGTSLVFYEKYGKRKTRFVPAKAGTTFTAKDARITITTLDANAESITITDARARDASTAKE